MTQTENDTGEAAQNPRKSRKLLGILLMFMGASGLAGGGFFVAYSGVIPDPRSHIGATARTSASTSFIVIEPVMISLAPDASARYLRFSAQLEIDPAAHAEISRLTPRIVDVLNTYLRAVDPADLAEPAMMTRLRAQMLRRIQIVTGSDRVRDLLITEFVLS